MIDLQLKKVDNYVTSGFFKPKKSGKFWFV